MGGGVRKWLCLASIVVVESALFLACGGPDDVDNVPMIGDCMHGCGQPALSGGGTSGGGTNGTADAQAGTGGDAGSDVNATPDGLAIVDVGVQQNDVFGDQSASGFVDVGATGMPISGESPPTSPPP